MNKKKQICFVLLLVSMLLVSMVSFSKETKDNDTAVSSVEALKIIKQNVVVPEQKVVLDVYIDSIRLNLGEKENIYKKTSLCDTILQLLFTIIAVFLGAFFAFRFQNRREQRNIENKNYSALLKTQALFYQYQNVIAEINKDFLYKFKDDPYRMSKIKPISFCESFSKLDYEGLSFILATKESDLYSKITSSYSKCVSTIDVIKERSDHSRKIMNFDKSTEKYTKISQSKSDWDTLEILTDIMYRQTEQTLKDIKRINTQIQDFIKKTFKEKHSLTSSMIE